MYDRDENENLTNRQDEATDKRTLEEIEEDENVSSDSSDSPVPSPDQESGRSPDDDSGTPM